MGTSYKFLGDQGTVTQDEKLALECAAKVYLRRLLVISSTPLSDINRVSASNPFAMPALTYLMWTKHWPITELRVIDRAARNLLKRWKASPQLDGGDLFSKREGRARVAFRRAQKQVNEDQGGNEGLSEHGSLY